MLSILDSIIGFALEFRGWLRFRREARKLQGRPYFFGPPNSREASDRYEAFLRCTGLNWLATEEDPRAR